MTGNIIGILTLAYAIAIIIFVYSYQLADARGEASRFSKSFGGNCDSLHTTAKRLKSYADKLPELLDRKVQILVLKALRTLAEYENEVASS
jgi:hypothetical protein